MSYIIFRFFLCQFAASNVYKHLEGDDFHFHFQTSVSWHRSRAYGKHVLLNITVSYDSFHAQCAINIIKVLFSQCLLYVAHVFYSNTLFSFTVRNDIEVVLLLKTHAPIRTSAPV